jgi:APA family basic amino acid/polyamine antiporter
MARDVGDAGVILALWGLGGLLCLAGALAYAELGAALPRSGGEYVYIGRAYGPVWGHLSGWTSLTLGFGAAVAAAAVAFAELLAEGLGGSAAGLDRRVVALALVWALTAVHLCGVGAGGRFQQTMTWLKVAGIVLVFGTVLVLAGDALPEAAPMRPAPAAGLGAMAVSLIFVLYAFSGWNAAGYIAGEMARPAVDLPRAVVGGTLFVALLYLAVNVAYLRALPIQALGAEPVLPVAEKVVTAVLGEAATAPFSLLLCLSIAGSASAMIWVGPRVYREMAADGGLPAWLAVHSRREVPARALVAQALWISLLVTTSGFERLVIYSGLPLAVFSAMAVAAVVVLRVREPGLERPFRTPLTPCLAFAYVVALSGTAIWAAMERPFEAGIALATVAAGLVPWRLYRSRRLAEGLIPSRPGQAGASSR